MFPARSKWTIYGLRLVGSTEYRYVGLTRGNPRERLNQHKHPSHNPRLPVSKWASVYSEDVVMDILEEVSAGDDLGLTRAEEGWIAKLREEGHALLNLADGGASGSRGARWTLPPDKVRGGEKHPFYGRTHTEEAKQANREKHLGKRMPEAIRGYAGHVRWHTRRGISKPETCKYCAEELL